MRNQILAACAAALLGAACSSGGNGGTGGGSNGGGTAGTGGGGGSAGQSIDVRGTISADTTWSKANTYVLKEIVYVDGAKLTIEAGTKVLGDRGSALVVTRNNSQLISEGTKTEPIVFSANFPLGMRGVGNNNWGGIVLNGKAAVNVTGGDNLAEGLADEMRNRYGGGATPDNAYSCGRIKYTRIEFAGQPLSANNELNGLTLNACGTGTVVDYVQVHRGIDDGIELFGGSVSIKHVLMTGSDDDGLDWDQGWTGNGQFIIVQQLMNRGNHGIEADNNRNATDATPRSAPNLYNVTLVGRAPDNSNPGEGTSRGMVLRVGTAGKLNNFVVTNFNDFAVLVDGTTSIGQFTSGALTIRNSIFYKNPTAGWQNTPAPALADGGTAMDTFDESLQLSASSLSNLDVDPQLEDVLNPTAPNFKPKAGSPALTGGAAPSGDTFFDATATYRGAIGTDDWTSGWTAYPEN